jgi:uncharacterized membrane protein
MYPIIFIFLIAFFIFLAVDMVWLGLVAKNFYDKHLGHLLREDVNWPPAIIFYILFVIALVVFVIVPSLEKNSWIHALLYGAFFGLIAYATYDLTNLATLKGWPITVTVVDILWGAFLGGAVSLLTHLVVTKFLL